MRIPRSEVRIWYKKLLPIIGYEKFTVRDIKPYFSGISPNYMGTMLRLVWYHGYANKHGRNKDNIMVYSLRET